MSKSYFMERYEYHRSFGHGAAWAKKQARLDELTQRVAVLPTDPETRQLLTELIQLTR